MASVSRVVGANCMLLVQATPKVTVARFSRRTGGLQSAASIPTHTSTNPRRSPSCTAVLHAICWTSPQATRMKRESDSRHHACLQKGAGDGTCSSSFRTMVALAMELNTFLASRDMTQ